VEQASISTSRRVSLNCGSSMFIRTPISRMTRFHLAAQVPAHARHQQQLEQRPQRERQQKRRKQPCRQRHGVQDALLLSL